MRRFLMAARQERHLGISPEMPLEEALEKLDLWRNGQLMRAALLLFGREPQRFLRQSEGRVARFKGVAPLQFLDMQVIEGGLIAQRAAILAFIQRHGVSANLLYGFGWYVRESCPRIWTFNVAKFGFLPGTWRVECPHLSVNTGGFHDALPSRHPYPRHPRGAPCH